MIRKNENKTKENHKDEILFLYKTVDDMTLGIEIAQESKRANYILRRLRRIQITEIVVKIVAFSWALIWSAASFIYFLSGDHILMMLLTALPALGFWIILSKSMGSVTVISMEIKRLKKEIMEKDKQ